MTNAAVSLTADVLSYQFLAKLTFVRIALGSSGKRIKDRLCSKIDSPSAIEYILRK